MKILLTMHSKLNFFSLNVGMSSTLAGLPAIIKAENLDIIFLQEVRLSSDQIEHLLRGFKASANIDPSQPSKPGSAIVWRENISVTDVCPIVPCRAQVATLGPYKLLNLYAPSGSDKKHERSVFFGQEIFQILQLDHQAQWIMGGDFNCVLNSIDIEGGIGFEQKKCPALGDLVRVADMVDIFRIQFLRKQEFTFFRASCAPSRLDRFYLSAGLVGEVLGVSHVASLSDHCGIKLRVKMNIEKDVLPTFKRRTYWKLNTAILEENDFLPNFKQFSERILKYRCDFVDIAEWWDKLAKPEIKDFCIGFSVQRTLRRDHTKKLLLSYLKLSLERKDWNEVARVKSDLDLMLRSDAMGFVVRSRYKQNAEEEKASLFHAAKESKNISNNISKLKIGGQVVSDNSLIEEEVVGFFGALFNGHHNTDLINTGQPFVPDNSHMGDFMQGLSSMDNEASEKLHEDILSDEIDDIIKLCENNKAPGLDGLSYEFYKSTWEIIRRTFIMVLQCQLDRLRIVESNTMGATRLSSKVAGVPQVDELRPLTLLNCDYRILSKFMVGRMKPVLPIVIKSGQLCTVGNKNILFGINNILSSISYVKKKKMGACLLGLDFFKAYDRVLVDFLLAIMGRMNFSKQFCNWIKMLHMDAKTMFILQGLSRSIRVSFSIRQGDPLSMLLYIVYIEPLLIYIERKLIGLIIPHIPSSLEAYCDDVNVLTVNDADLIAVDDAVQKFEALSGAILSRDKKCKIVGFGKWKNRVDWPLQYVRTVGEIKVFGIYIMDSYQDMLKRNWSFRFSKFEQSILSWSGRVLETIFQRVEVIKTFALSRIYYLASILPIPQTFVKNIERVMGKFIWSASGKVLRVSLDEMKNPVEKGGCGLVCIKSMSKSLFLVQALRLLKSGDQKSVSHLGYWIGELLGDFLPGVELGDHAEVSVVYYDYLADLVVDAKLSEHVTVENWRFVTNKIIYKIYSDAFQVPKVEVESGLSYKRVWKCLDNPSLTSVSKEILFLLIHNKLPVRERMFRIGLVTDPYCDYCFDNMGAVICDLVHFFCTCQRVSQVWRWLKILVQNLLSTGAVDLPDWDLINLRIPRNINTNEVIWLLGSYLSEVWASIVVRGVSELSQAQFYGFLKFKYKKDQLGARLPLKQIQGLG